MPALELLAKIPWRWLIPALVVVVAFFLFGGLRGCARFSRAIERMDIVEVKDILLSPASDYDKL